MIQPNDMSTFLAVCLAAVAAAMAPHPSPAQDAKAHPARVGSAVPLSADASAQLAERVLAHPDLPQRVKGHRLAAIRVTAEETAAAADAAKTTVVTVVLFDHTVLEARRVRMNSATNQLLLNERLPGRPQRSDRELAEAAAIVARDPILGRLLSEGGVLDGGFIVDDPGGSRRRMIQMKLMSANRRAALRSIVVDLTAGEIAAVTDAHGAPGGGR
jgi:hypothetical protein